MPDRRLQGSANKFSNSGDQTEQASGDAALPTPHGTKMCGIVGYVGVRPALDYVLEGLRRLEYRGYDSAGIATIAAGGEFQIAKSVGRIAALTEVVAADPPQGSVGIGHTRWATHGPPTHVNAHPHVGGDPPRVAIAHNGVIENFESLKARLVRQGVVFHSATDTEVIAHLIALALEDVGPLPSIASLNGKGRKNDPLNQYEPLFVAVDSALEQLQGTYGLVVLFSDYPELILAARVGSPLVVGVGDKEHFIASDASPLVGYTDKIVYLADKQMALLTADHLHVRQRGRGHVRLRVEQLQQESTDTDLGDYPHYMLKEIFEQPQSLRNAMRGRLDREDATAVFGGLNLKPQSTARN